MKSLRRTLAVRFSATMLLGLVGIAAWAYVGVRRLLREELDRTLRNAAQAQSDVVQALGSPPVHVGTADREAFIQAVNQLVVLRDSAGRIVAANTPLARDLPLDAEGLARARLGHTAFATEPWLGGTVRAIYLPAPPGPQRAAAVLEVAASLEPLEAATRTALYRMLGTVLLGSLATFVGAGWLARSAVTPISEIAEQARAITGGVTGERITAHADVAECRSLVDVLNDMLSRLERAREWHRRIIHDLGHDLRTPITALRAGAEVALWAERKPEEYRRALASTLEEADRLTLIGDALVLLGLLESGDVVPDFAELDARGVAREAIGRAQERLAGHRLLLARSDDPVTVEGDARLLGMVLDQLVDNALRYTPPGCTIEISVAKLDDRVDLLVEDDGPGVSDEVLPHLFERFFRADTARARNGGPGLGLTVATEIVELHHGTIHAERGCAGGLRVRIDLPRRQPASVKNS